MMQSARKRLTRCDTRTPKRNSFSAAHTLDRLPDKQAASFPLFRCYIFDKQHTHSHAHFSFIHSLWTLTFISDQALYQQIFDINVKLETVLRWDHTSCDAKSANPHFLTPLLPGPLLGPRPFSNSNFHFDLNSVKFCDCILHGCDVIMLTKDIWTPSKKTSSVIVPTVGVIRAITVTGGENVSHDLPPLFRLWDFYK